jgi:hypothetical protein
MIVPKHRELRVKDIRDAPYNPPGRVEGQGIRELADSMSRIGLVYPVLVDEDNVLIEGHRRLAAARLLGWETVKAMVMPSEQRDQIYAGVNSTAKRMMGRSVLVAVREECRRLDRWRERIREAVELIGYGNVTGGVHKLEMLLGES